MKRYVHIGLPSTRTIPRRRSFRSSFLLSLSLHPSLHSKLFRLGGGTPHRDGPLKNVRVVVIRRHGERVGVPRTTLGPEPFQRLEVTPLRRRRARLRVPTA